MSSGLQSMGYPGTMRPSSLSVEESVNSSTAAYSLLYALLSLPRKQDRLQASFGQQPFLLIMGQKRALKAKRAAR